MHDFIAFGGCHNGSIKRGILKGDSVHLFAESLVRDRDVHSHKKVEPICLKEFLVERYIANNGHTYFVAKFGNVESIATTERLECVINVFKPKPIN